MNNGGQDFNVSTAQQMNYRIGRTGCAIQFANLARYAYFTIGGSDDLYIKVKKNKAINLTQSRKTTIAEMFVLPVLEMAVNHSVRTTVMPPTGEGVTKGYAEQH